MVVIPLIFPKLILAASIIDQTSGGKMALWAIILYFGQNIVNEFLSVGFCFLLQPGVNRGAGEEQQQHLETDSEAVSAPLVVVDLFKNAFPSNIIKAMIFQAKTIKQNTSSGGELFQETYIDSTNNLGLVIFSIAFGFALKLTPSTSKPLVIFFEGLSEAMMKLISWIILFGPVGVFSLVWYQTLQVDAFSSTLSEMGLFVATILIVLFIHCWVLMPILFLVVTRRNPYRWMYNMREIVPIVIATSSSLACLPITTRCLEQKNCASSNVVRSALTI